MMWGPWGWGMGVGSAVFLALIVIGIVLMFRTSSGGESRQHEDNARRILDERFARGEIDEKEYRRNLSTLEDSRR